MVSLATPVGELSMVGPAYERLLEKLGIRTVEDLLFHVPFRYDDLSVTSLLAVLQEGEKVSVGVTVEKYESVYTKNGRRIQKVTVTDHTGSSILIFFNQPYLKNIFLAGTKISVAGEVSVYQNKKSFISPQFELVREGLPLIHTARLVPVYPETEGLSSKWLRSRISVILNRLKIFIPEILPGGIADKFGLMPLMDALYKIHFPDSVGEARLARDRLSFDELLIANLGANARKKKLSARVNPFKFDRSRYKDDLASFIESLPFKLTLSQITSVDEIMEDLTSNKLMNRLLQGDVGSGKTVVSTIAAYFMYLNGYRTVFMAPTEILARQHFESFKRFLSGKKIKIALVTADNNPDSEQYDIYIGTHALLHRLQKDKKIALAIIDEQQRFGVEQRAVLREKAILGSHLLSMTATPIPRTVALTLYSDLDMSVIRELPEGRIPVATFVVPPHKRDSAYSWITREIKESGFAKRAFIICPFIEESESLATVKSAKKEYDRLKKDIFRELKVGLLHGKMKTAEKSATIDKFRGGGIDILVATPVVEVGIDIPQATIILIEGAERFGLSQIHQLRGRVGRGSLKSYCLLFTEVNTEKVINRLKILETQNIGIKIAESDLKLRGPGEFYGTRQHGMTNLRIADLSEIDTVKNALSAASQLTEKSLNLDGFPHLRERLLQYTIPTISLD